MARMKLPLSYKMTPTRTSSKIPRLILCVRLDSTSQTMNLNCMRKKKRNREKSNARQSKRKRSNRVSKMTVRKKKRTKKITWLPPICWMTRLLKLLVLANSQERWLLRSRTCLCSCLEESTLLTFIVNLLSYMERLTIIRSCSKISIEFSFFKNLMAYTCVISCSLTSLWDRDLLCTILLPCTLRWRGKSKSNWI